MGVSKGFTINGNKMVLNRFLRIIKLLSIPLF